MNALAVDLGASNGRVVVGAYDDHTISLQEVHRFANDPVHVGQRLHWDILRLLHEVKQGILRANRAFPSLESMGIDAWAVDFGLLDADGELLANPIHYRDAQTAGMVKAVGDMLGVPWLFGRTGIQIMDINTIYQLHALLSRDSAPLREAQSLLLIPELLRYFLTGRRVSEYSNASTTQLLNLHTRDWDPEILHRLGLRASLFSEIVQPGTPVGSLSAAVCTELGVPSIPVLAVGEHDTASAVAATPAETENFVYLISGTWSLMGTELAQPIVTDEALRLNFTNEGGVRQTFRFLKNIMGLWLLQECKRAWEQERAPLSFSDMTRLSERAKPFRCFIDPDHPMFLRPAHMPRQIQEFCRDTGQYVPESEGEVVRCVMESLALKYRYVFDRITSITKQRYGGLHIVGGGVHNSVLCQYTANAVGIPVWAGPDEASSIGNLLVQWIATGHIADLQEGRSIVRRSFPATTYDSQDRRAWEQAYTVFCTVVERRNGHARGRTV